MITQCVLLVASVLLVQMSCQRKAPEPEAVPRAEVFQTQDLVTVRITAAPDTRVEVVDHKGQVALQGRYADLASRGPVEVDFKKADLQTYLESLDTCLEGADKLTARFSAVTEKGRVVDKEPLVLMSRALQVTALDIVEPPMRTEHTDRRIRVTLRSEEGARIEGEGLAEPIIVQGPPVEVTSMDLGLGQGKVERKLSACVSGKSRKTIVAEYVRKLDPEQMYRDAKELINKDLFFSSIKKNPDLHRGEKVLLGGKILQVVSEQDGKGALLLQSVGNTGQGLCLISYTYEGKESPLTEDVYATFYAAVEGSYDYQTKTGGSNTVPRLRAIDYWHLHPARGGHPWIMNDQDAMAWFWVK